MARSELSDPIPVRSRLEVLADIEAVAATCERTRSWVVVRALRQYLAGEGADILAVQRARDQVAAGDVHDMDEALREAEEIVRGKVAQRAI